MSAENMICTLGIYDIPIVQMQPKFQVNLLETNVMVLGSAMSGKTTFLKTLINIQHKLFRENQEQIFILDFGGALFPYQELPLVAAYFDNSNEEYVKRVFKILEGILRDNIKALNGKNYADSPEPPIHTTFILDNINAFLDEPRYSTYQEKLAKLCRDGLSKGITIVMTASDSKGLSSYMSSFKQKIAFDLPQEKYQEIFNEKVGGIGNNPGHGFANVTVKIPNVPGSFRYNYPYEVQCCMPFSADSLQTSEGEFPEEFLLRLQQKFAFDGKAYQNCVKKYRTFPKDLMRADYEELLQKGGYQDLQFPGLPVGLDYVDFKPVTVDLGKSHVLGIYGKKEFGKTNLLRQILNEAIAHYPELRIVMVDDGRSQLSADHLQLNRQPAELVRFDQFVELERMQDNALKKFKRSPIQQFFVFLNENYISWDKAALAECYGISRNARPMEIAEAVPNCSGQPQPMTILVLQSKAFYLASAQNKYFLSSILPQLAADAEENRLVFLFSDIQRFSETEYGQYLNTRLNVAFLMDNIAEFAGERGQRSVFGSMDVKSLKEDYARCERGDGYYYDVEADDLKKVKFLKAEEALNGKEDENG